MGCRLGESCTLVFNALGCVWACSWGYSPLSEEKNTVIDEIDREILRHVQQAGRATHRELGKAVGLSPNAAGARMSRLVDRSIITGFHAAVDHASLGRPLDVVIDVWLENRPSDAAFRELVASDDRIVEALHITGPVDYRIRARVGSPEDLENLLSRLRIEAGVNQTDSRIIMGALPTI